MNKEPFCNCKNEGQMFIWNTYRFSLNLFLGKAALTLYRGNHTIKHLKGSAARQNHNTTETGELSRNLREPCQYFLADSTLLKHLQ